MVRGSKQLKEAALFHAPKLLPTFTLRNHPPDGSVRLPCPHSPASQYFLRTSGRNPTKNPSWREYRRGSSEKRVPLVSSRTFRRCTRPTDSTFLLQSQNPDGRRLGPSCGLRLAACL